MLLLRQTAAKRSEPGTCIPRMAPKQVWFGLSIAHPTKWYNDSVQEFSCCKTRNNVHLSQLENQMKTLLFERSVQEARQHLDQVFIWIIKILLAIVYAERLLPLSRRYPTGKRI